MIQMVMMSVGRNGARSLNVQYELIAKLIAHLALLDREIGHGAAFDCFIHSQDEPCEILVCGRELEGGYVLG
jgi:hypothetical protein